MLHEPGFVSPGYHVPPQGPRRNRALLTRRIRFSFQYSGSFPLFSSNSSIRHVLRKKFVQGIQSDYHTRRNASLWETAFYDTTFVCPSYLIWRFRLALWIGTLAECVGTPSYCSSLEQKFIVHADFWENSLDGFGTAWERFFVYLKVEVRALIYIALKARA